MNSTIQCSALAMALVSVFAIDAQAGALPSITFVDAHKDRHCHSIHRFTRCHKSDRLPRNWPPLTDTPHGQTFEWPKKPVPARSRDRVT